MNQGTLFEEVGFSIGDVESRCRESGLRYVVGIDEAGRGPLAGPVYAAAVWMDLENVSDTLLSCLDDSKKLSEKAREDAYELLIEEPSLVWSSAKQTNSQIDTINILQATLKAMLESLDDVLLRCSQEPQVVLVDGNTPIATDLNQQTLVKGDGRSYAIAAASIVAKVERDREMRAYHDQWPNYGFDSNKGYGSRMHRDAIATYGPTPIHRMSFGGVREHAHKAITDRRG